MSASDGVPSVADSPPGATILVVEDHAATRRALMDLVGSSIAGVRVVAAESAEAALELLPQAAPDIVVMDISLPGMNGIEATRRILHMAPGIRVVMHSSSDMQIYRDESAAAGASAFVSKQSTARELVPAISGLLP